MLVQVSMCVCVCFCVHEHVDMYTCAITGLLACGSVEGIEVGGSCGGGRGGWCCEGNLCCVWVLQVCVCVILWIVWVCMCVSMHVWV